MKQNLLFILLLASINCMAVVDTIPPVITLNGQSSIDHILNSTYTDAGATAFDNVDGNITSSITTNISATNPNKDLAGNYTITYSVTDQGGNTGTATRTVHVYNQADFLVDAFYNGYDSCQSSGGIHFNGNITISSTNNWVFTINNFGAFGSSIYINAMATATTAGSAITFPPNQPLWSQAYIISATGAITSLSPVSFTVSYQWTDGLMSEQCNSIYILNNSISVNEITTKNFIKIYPNPSDGLINIESMSGEIDEVLVYDMHGILVHLEKMNDREAKIDLSEKAAGIYFLRIRTNGKEQIEKIIVK